MSELQKIMAELWDAEREAKKRVEESKRQAEALLQEAEEYFAKKRSAKLEEAKQAAEKLLDVARGQAREEAEKLLKKAETERSSLKTTFENRVDSAVEDIAAECVKKYKSRVAS